MISISHIHEYYMLSGENAQKKKGERNVSQNIQRSTLGSYDIIPEVLKLISAILN